MCLFAFFGFNDSRFALRGASVSARGSYRSLVSWSQMSRTRGTNTVLLVG